MGRTVKERTSKYTDVQHISWKKIIMPSCEIRKRNQSALMQRIRSPGTLWKSNNRFCICSLFHLMISTSLLLPLIIGNVAVGGTTIPIESVEDELTALGDQSTSDVLEQENDQMVDPEYSQDTQEQQDDLDDFPLYQAQNFIDPRYQRAIPPDMLLRAGKRAFPPSNPMLSDEDEEQQDITLDELISFIDGDRDLKTKKAQTMLLRAGKRSPMLLRAGKRSPLLQGKRSSMLLRAGRSGRNTMLLRAGKRAAGMYLRAGKRSSDIASKCPYNDCSLLPIFYQHYARLPLTKRGGSMYLRAGKRSSAGAPQEKKAGNMYLRAGKRSLDFDSGKRAKSSMLLRAGKRGRDSMLLRAGKRAGSSMLLRAGKRGSSMYLRSGK